MVATNGKNPYQAMAEAIADQMRPHFLNLGATLGKKLDNVRQEVAEVGEGLEEVRAEVQTLGQRLDRHLKGAASISVRVARLERDLGSLKRRR